MLQLSDREQSTYPVKVSVIVPVYNVEPYIRRCLDSLLVQTLKDIEIICINDCSPDCSIDIMLEYEAKDSRVKVIDLPENQGVAGARNAGIDISMGEFIGFVDPDDAVDHDFFEVLYKKAYSTGADISKGARKRVDVDGTEVVDMSNEMIRQNKAFFSASFWSAIYRGSMIRKNHILFPEGIHIGEDLVFQARCILESKRFVTSDFVYYKYFMREGSAVSAFNKGEWLSDDLVCHVRSAFSLIFDYANRAYAAGRTDDATYDTLYYNTLGFSIIVIMLTDDPKSKYDCTEMIVNFYNQCKRKKQLDHKLQDEQSSFYEILKQGDLKKLVAYLCFYVPKI